MITGAPSPPKGGLIPDPAAFCEDLALLGVGLDWMEERAEKRLANIRGRWEMDFGRWYSYLKLGEEPIVESSRWWVELWFVAGIRNSQRGTF
ncbi:hypothetical protein AVEN_141408-1 [Araneus ventricosus]|uniref:Uncharacterized protein n=1 Tax=Araneus ventricosus TaxID=182803 RepID=A0A4Y2CYN4_ARAVE|nr:hypothetical protein AVEN_141408-1 [Araneus ventricosus]